MAGRHRREHGRHRRPEPPRSTTARAALAGTAIVAPVGLALLDSGTAVAAPAAGPPGGWGAIVHCESGGNPQASNGTHFGLFQFDLRTWQSAGGVGHPLNASPAAQINAANRLFAMRGTQPWIASQSCWRGTTRPLTVRAGATPSRPVTAARTGTAKPAAKPAVKPAVKPQRKPVVAPRRNTGPAPVRAHSHRVLRGDTVLRIARANGVPWRSVHGFRSGNPNLIYPGELLRWQ